MKNGIDAIREMENNAILKYGWYAHLVPGGDDTPFGFNAHTHNLPQAFNHKDIQIVLPLDANVVMEILHNVVDNIVKKEDGIVSGKEYHKIIANYPVKFVEATESGRDVMRMIFPDQHGILDEEKMAEDYKKQFLN